MLQHVLLPVNIHFHWNLFIFEFLTIFFNFYIGGHFEMAAILKIIKTKNTTLSDNLFLCQVSKGSAVRFSLERIYYFLHLGDHGNGHHCEFVQPSKAATHYGGYFYKVSWSLMKGIQFCFNPPFLFPWQLRQNLSNQFRFFYFFWLISFHLMWMLFLSSFINFCSASNLLWSFMCFSIF